MHKAVNYFNKKYNNTEMVLKLKCYYRVDNYKVLNLNFKILNVSQENNLKKILDSLKKYINGKVFYIYLRQP